MVDIVDRVKLKSVKNNNIVMVLYKGVGGTLFTPSYPVQALKGLKNEDIQQKTTLSEPCLE